MQLVGDRFTDVSAAFGNDLATLPNYPAEIRAPAGTIAGVSSFQVHIADFDIVTPGDVPNLLVAMNPAALKANVGDLPPGASIIANTDAFEPRNLEKAGYAGNPLDDDSLAAFTVYPVPMTRITVEAAKETGAKPRDAERSKNFFALGLISWMYTRPIDGDHRVDRRAVRQERDRPRREPRRVQGRLQLRRDRRALRPRRSRCSPAHAAARPVPQHHAATSRSRTASSPRARRPSCRSSTRRTRSRRRPTSCTSSRSTRTSACARCRPRTRSRRSVSRSAARSPASSA